MSNIIQDIQYYLEDEYGRKDKTKEYRKAEGLCEKLYDKLYDKLDDDCKRQLEELRDELFMKEGLYGIESHEEGFKLAFKIVMGAMD